ncbi:MAG: vitamin K epoxide reductase family protein [Pyrinomonadaceae bacterium]
MRPTQMEATRAEGAHLSRVPALYVLAALLALAGLADALYLTIEHLTGSSVRCTVSGGCNEVLSSAYAKIGAIPTASLGALAYFMAFSLTTLVIFGYRSARAPLAVLVVIMLATSIGLVCVQAFVLHAFCEFCLLSALITTLLATVVFIARLKERRD